LPTKTKENSILNHKGRREGAVKQMGPECWRRYALTTIKDSNDVVANIPAASTETDAILSALAE